MSGLAPSGGYQDDVVLLLYRHPAPLELTFPADVNHLAPTRSALRSWLTRARLDPDQTMDVLVAAGEAVANAIEHGHRHRPEGTISLGATALDDEVQLTITDTGSWKPPQPAAHPIAAGASPLMRGLMHDVTSGPTPPEPRFTYPRGSPDDHVAHARHRAGNDGKLVLIAAGEIDLSNVDAFNQALTSRHRRGRQRRRNADSSTSARWSTWTAPPSTPCSPTPTTSSSSPTRS